METKVLAKYPIVFSLRWKLFAFPILAIFYFYLCLDMTFFHHFQTTSNPWNWLVFGVLVFFTYLLFEGAFSATLKADGAGLELQKKSPYHFLKVKIRIPWDKVIDIKSGKHTVTYPRTNLPEFSQECDEIEITFDDSIELSMIDGLSVRANPKNKNSILIGGYLFVDDLNNLQIVVEKLHLLRSKAIK